MTVLLFLFVCFTDCTTLMSGILLLVDGLENSKYFRREMPSDTDVPFVHKILFQLVQNSHPIFSEIHCFYKAVYYKEWKVLYLEA